VIRCRPRRWPRLKRQTAPQHRLTRAWLGKRGLPALPLRHGHRRSRRQDRLAQPPGSAPDRSDGLGRGEPHVLWAAGMPNTRHGVRADSCVTELAIAHRAPLPEIRVDVDTGNGVAALWIAAAPLTDDSSHVVLQLRPGLRNNHVQPGRGPRRQVVGPARGVLPHATALVRGEGPPLPRVPFRSRVPPAPPRHPHPTRSALPARVATLTGGSLRSGSHSSWSGPSFVSKPLKRSGGPSKWIDSSTRA
jgi:hypothetical protein